ncbi:2,3-diketo-5-methylthio-1-phosphopentane phosphatase, partial [Gorgonomyces haynaldii]
ILTDIEGTTTPISFVKEVLFPHVYEHCQQFLTDRWDEKETQDCVKALKEQSEKDQQEGLKFTMIDDTVASVVKNIQEQMDQDRKITALKQFQGYMWRFAYENGQVQGVVYDDVVEQLKHWKSKDLPVSIYSSGSVMAQKLLFQYSTHGNLLEYFVSHFDTKIGSKLETKSYKDIAKELDVKPKHVLFLSDNVKELDAAKKAGMQVKWLIRPGNAPDTSNHPQVASFDEI